MRLAELRDAFLVEDASDGVHPLHPAAVGEHLRRAVVQQPDGARPRRRVLGSLHQRFAVAFGPGHEPHAFVEGDLLAQLKVSRGEPERDPPRVRGGLRLSQKLQGAGQAPRRFGAARGERGGGAQRGDRGWQLLARRLHVRELLEARGLRGTERGGELEEGLGPGQVASAARGLRRSREAVSAAEEHFRVLALIGRGPTAARQIGEELQRFAPAGGRPQGLLRARPSAGRVSARVQQPGASHQHARWDGRPFLAERGFGLVEVLGRIVEALRVALQRRRGQTGPDEQRVLARGLRQV